jgi:hypothetical protein
MKVKRKIFFLLLCCFTAAVGRSFAQDVAVATADELKQLIQRSKQASQLEELNAIRLRLRQIEFARLTDRHRQELYTEAYHQLALAHRENRFIRPAYDIYEKYLALKDTLMVREYHHRLDSTVQISRLRLSDLKAQTDSMERVIDSYHRKIKKVIDLRINFLSYCLIFTILIASIVFYLYTAMRRQIIAFRQRRDDARQQLQTIYEEHTRGRMYAGLMMQLITLNHTLSDHHQTIQKSFTEVKNRLNDVSECQHLIKKFSDDEGRLARLKEINQKALQPFMHL